MRPVALNDLLLRRDPTCQLRDVVIDVFRSGEGGSNIGRHRSDVGSPDGSSYVGE